MNEYLRKQVKLLKAVQDVTYKEIAEYLEIRIDSMYSWLSGYYDFGQKKQERLLDIIANLKEM